MAPASLHAAASRRIRRLYAVENRRRVALSLTSVFGLSAVDDIMFPIVHASLAQLGLLTNLQSGRCLTIIGIEASPVRVPTQLLQMLSRTLRNAGDAVTQWTGLPAR
jgi:hypothetical protein